MPEGNLDSLISNIESSRSSRVLVYITLDRQRPLNAKIASDIIPIFHKHLTRIGNTDKIDLFIYSIGGDVITPWRLVNLIREFSANFSVLIPYRAHSAATMIALGADEIVMGTLGELSPIDPSIGTPFNPPHPDVPNEPKIEISVEDVFGYINLTKEKLGIKEQSSVVSVLEKLVDRIHPLAIGAVYRTYSLIRLLAAKLLSLHMNQKKEAKQINKLVENLVEKLYFHNYLISRNEAEKLGLKITKPSVELEQLLFDLYLLFKEEMDLGKIFNPNQMIPDGHNSHSFEASIACICSRGLHSKYLKAITLSKLPSQQLGAPPQVGINEESRGWRDFENEQGE